MSEDFVKSITFAIMSAQRDVLYEAIRSIKRVREDTSLSEESRKAKLADAIEYARSLLPESENMKKLSDKELGTFHDVLG